MARLALICALLPAAGPVAADHFVIGVEDLDYAPIMGPGPGGEFRGYARELLDLFARRQGHSFEYRPLPNRRLTLEHAAGHLDAVFPDNPSWKADAKQAQTLTYSEPAVPFQDAVMVPAARRDQVPRELGILRGFTPKRFVPLIESGQLHVTEAGDPGQLMRMVLAGRVDAVHLALPVARHQLAQIDQPGALVPTTALPSARYELHYRLSSAQHPELIRQFDKFLHEEAAALTALQRRYGLDERLPAPAAVSPAPR